MRTILCFLVLLLAVVLGSLISHDSGYVALTYGDTTVETTFWVAIGIAALIFVILLLLARLIFLTGVLPRKIKVLFSNRRNLKAQACLRKAILAIVSEDWGKAEKYIGVAVPESQILTNVTRHLALAYVAQRKKDYPGRDEHFRQALELYPRDEVAIKTWQAKLQSCSGQWTESLATMDSLGARKYDNKDLLLCLVGAYFRAEAWQKLQELLPKLRKRQFAESVDVNKLEDCIYQKWMTQCLAKPEQEKVTEGIEGLWRKMPTRVRQVPNVLVLYLRYLLQQKLLNKAEKIFSQSLPNVWDKRLLALYVEFVTLNNFKGLSVAESWLSEHPQDLDLLLCLGKLCHNQQLWAKAKNYFEQSIKVQPSVEAYYALGQIAKSQGDLAVACGYFQHGLQQSLQLYRV
jgi:HemY protein